ncbi:MAG: PAS domain S-box protein [Anaerolineales bacterium]|nr:PAS domain S-box protein [Anaerolineales bacterium]
MSAAPPPPPSLKQPDDLTAAKQALAERELRRYQAQLEQKIQEQTAELARVNEQLQSHIDAGRWIEQKLIAERDFIAAILDTVDALIIVLDREGRTIRFNRTCEETTGYTFDEVRDQPFWNLFLISAEVEPVRAVLAELRADRISNRHEAYWLTRDGRKRLIAWSNTALLDDNGEVDYIICTGIDITERRLAETQTQRLAALEERQRLARELHDAVTQTLFSASLIAEVLPEMWERDPARSRRLLQDLKQLSRGALAEMRTLLLELRPAALREAKLGDLIRQLAEAFTGREGVPVTVELDRQGAFPGDMQVSLYRITQEALNNIAKHAGASRVTIQLQRTPGGSGPLKRVELKISDDGCGFDPASVPLDHLGLGIMRERAEAIGATLDIISRPSRGTQIKVKWKG